MNSYRLPAFFIVGCVCLTVGLVLFTAVASTQADPVLLPCGAFEEMRLLQTPEPKILEPVPTPAAPLPTAVLRPAPAEDRVGFPENYATDYKLLFVFDRPDRRWARAICGNEIAARRQDGEPFDYGSVLMMITYSAKLDADNQPVLDENGHYIRENIVELHVQRKEEGFGEAYGEDRAGEWEFVGYNADGSHRSPPETSNNCAVCHLTQAGESTDFVFRMNLFHDGEAAFTPPQAGENEISIFHYGFHEPLLEIKAGTTVTWVNHDEAVYQIVEAIIDEEGKLVPAEEPLFKSPALPSANIEPGASFSFTFDQPGEYLYLSAFHMNTSGKIVVTE